MLVAEMVKSREGPGYDLFSYRVLVALDKRLR